MATFPYTPGYIHAEQLEYRIGIVQFVDRSEQRFAMSGQQGLRLTYEWPVADSGTIAEIASWFAAYGQTDSFSVLDHRTGTTYSARHAEPTFTLQRGPIDKRSVSVQFVTVGAGSVIPTGVAFTPADPHTCPLYSDSITPSANGSTSAGSGTPPVVVTSTAPPTSTHAGSGGLPVDSGTDGGPWSYIQTSVWHICGHWTGDTNAAGGSNIGRRYVAMPFIVARSGSVLGRFGLFNVSVAGGSQMMRMGVYCQRTPTDVLPGNLVYAAPEMPVALGEMVASCSIVLSAALYYVVAVTSGNAVQKYSNLGNNYVLGRTVTGLGGILGWRYPLTPLPTYGPLPSTYDVTSVDVFDDVPNSFLFMIVG